MTAGAAVRSMWRSRSPLITSRHDEEDSVKENRGRILVVDDVEQNRIVVGALVESLGYEVETANDGLEALGKLGDGIDLVLLDVMMPGLSGFDVLRRMRG